MKYYFGSLLYIPDSNNFIDIRFKTSFIFVNCLLKLCPCAVVFILVSPGKMRLVERVRIGENLF